MIWIAVEEDLSSSLARHIRRDLLKLARRALPLDLDRILRDLVLEQPTRILPPPQHKLRIRLLSLDNALLDIIMNRRLNRAHKPRAHIDPLSAQTQRSSKSLPVRKPTRSNKRHRHRLPRAGKQDEVRNIALAHMTGTFKPINAQKVHTQLHRTQSMPNRRTLVQNHTRRVRLLQHLDHRARTIARRLHNPDAFLNHHAGVGAVVWRHHGGQESDVDAEGEFGHGSRAADFFAQVFGRGLREGCEDAEAAGVGDGGGELGVAYPHHAALNDGD